MLPRLYCHRYQTFKQEPFKTILALLSSPLVLLPPCAILGVRLHWQNRTTRSLTCMGFLVFCLHLAQHFFSDSQSSGSAAERNRDRGQWSLIRSTARPLDQQSPLQPAQYSLASQPPLATIPKETPATQPQILGDKPPLPRMIFRG